MTALATYSSSYLVFGIELPWVFPLATELARLAPTLGIRFGASWTPRRKPWPFRDPYGQLETCDWTYPPGFNGTFGGIFRSRIRQRLEEAQNAMQRRCGNRPYVVVPYPVLLDYLDVVNDDHLIYLNHDEYGRVQPDGSVVDDPREAELLRRAVLVLANSRRQAERLRVRREPLGPVHHLPHGVHEAFINPDPLRPPMDQSICAVGYLTGRYDWALIEKVVEAMADVIFRFVGEIGPDAATSAEDCAGAMRRVLRQANVEHIPGLRHEQTPAHYWRSAVNWMPYRATLPFVQSSCPLKLTDGLASGRPVVSADVPECRLYPEWIRVYDDCDSAVRLLRDALAQTRAADESQRAERQIAFARGIRWADRAEHLHRLTGDLREMMCERQS